MQYWNSRTQTHRTSSCAGVELPYRLFLRKQQVATRVHGVFPTLILSTLIEETRRGFSLSLSLWCVCVCVHVRACFQRTNEYPRQLASVPSRPRRTCTQGLKLYFSLCRSLFLCEIFFCLFVCFRSKGPWIWSNKHDGVFPKSESIWYRDQKKTWEGNYWKKQKTNCCLCLSNSNQTFMSPSMTLRLCVFGRATRDAHCGDLWSRKNRIK